MKYLHWLLLSIFEKLHQERTIGGVYHLLTGKHSAQTIQDAHFFNITPFVGILKGYNREKYFSAIKYLLNKQYIVIDEEMASVTDKGKSYLKELEKNYDLPEHYHGGQYEWNRSSHTLWDRLSLTIQTLSFLLVKQRTFIPISYGLETQQWVKLLFQKNNFQYQSMSESIYEELIQFLLTCPERERNLFVKRLTGHEQVGKTFDQLCEPYHSDPLYTKIYFQSILHRYMTVCGEAPHAYPTLRFFSAGLDEQHVVTVTALKTWEFVKEGKNPEEIAQIRRLKNSTIEDHLVELAIYHPDFSYSNYISNQDMEEVLSVAKKLGTKRLRLIKESLPPDISYFQIRLALTMFAERKNDHESIT